MSKCSCGCAEGKCECKPGCKCGCNHKKGGADWAQKSFEKAWSFVKTDDDMTVISAKTNRSGSQLIVIIDGSIGEQTFEMGEFPDIMMDWTNDDIVDAAHRAVPEDSYRSWWNGQIEEAKEQYQILVKYPQYR